jgi:Flp pilus assembly CpaE family ATPase
MYIHDGKIIAFCGTTPNVGTTLVSLASAMLLASDKSEKIGYFCLNLKSSHVHHFFSVTPKFTLDRLHPEMQAQCLNEQRLMEVMEKPVKELPNFHVLYGNQYREMAERYTPSEISSLLHLATKLFSIVIVDVNAYWDNAATLQAWLQANEKVVVTTGKYTNFHIDWSNWFSHLRDTYNLNVQANLVVVNQWQEQRAIHSLQDIARTMGIPKLTAIPYSSELDAHFMQGTLSKVIKQSSFRNDLLTVVRSISALELDVLGKGA